MKNKIRKALRSKKKKSAAKIRNSVARWMDRSKDFVSTFPTLTELREELADWRSFEPLNLQELEIR